MDFVREVTDGANSLKENVTESQRGQQQPQKMLKHTFRHTNLDNVGLGIMNDDSQL